MHDGCNARAWVQVLLGENAPVARRAAPARRPGDRRHHEVPHPGRRRRAARRRDRRRVVADAEARGLRDARRRADALPRARAARLLHLGRRECCLPKGATRATLAGTPRAPPAAATCWSSRRRPGRAPGAAADADPAHRHAVRLTARDAGARIRSAAASPSPPTDDRQRRHRDRVEQRATRCPFPLCISATVPGDGGTTEPRAISVALGNIVLADHGRSVTRAARRSRAGADGVPRAGRTAGPVRATRRVDPVPARYPPGLAAAAAHAAPRRTTADAAGAAAAMRWAVGRRDAGDRARERRRRRRSRGQPRRDLLGSSATAPDFVVEIEHDLAGDAPLRRRRPRPPAGRRHDLHRALPGRQRGRAATSAPRRSPTS